MKIEEHLSIPLLQVSIDKRPSEQTLLIKAQKSAQSYKVIARSHDGTGPYIPSIQTIVPPKNMCRLVWLMVIAGIYPMYVGYILYMGFMASYQSYQSVYNIPTNISSVVVTCMILGVVPLGGIFSSLFLPEVLKYVNKRDVVFVFLVMSVIFCGITCIPNFIALMIGRFGLGLVCAWENSMGAGLIRDMSPIQYRQMFQVVFFVSRTFGMTLCLFFAFIFNYDLNYPQLCIFGYVPAMLALFQAICVKVFIPILPTELVAKKSEQGLKSYYSQLYSSQNVDQAVLNCVHEFKDMDKQFSYAHNGRTEQEKQKALQIYKQMQSKALFISLFSTVIRQFCGINYVVFYGNYAFQNAGSQYLLLGAFVFSFIQWVFSFLGLLICHLFSRRTVYLIGGAGCIAGTLIMAICDLLQNYTGVLVGAIIFIIIISSTVNPVVWPYPIETISPLETKYSSLINWSSAFLITIVPVRRISYEFFFAIFTYFVFCEIICYIFMIQTKDLTLREVFTNYMKDSYVSVDKSKYQFKNKGISNGKEGTIITSVESAGLMPKIFD